MNLAVAYAEMWRRYQQLAIAYSHTTARLEREIAALRQEVESLRRVQCR